MFLSARLLLSKDLNIHGWLFIYFVPPDNSFFFFFTLGLVTSTCGRLQHQFELQNNKMTE